MAIYGRWKVYETLRSSCKILDILARF